MTLHTRNALARSPFVWLLAIVVGIAATQQWTSTQAPTLDVPAAVVDTVEAEGIARVIVGVRTGFVPEGYLADQANVAQQRDEMHAAVDGTMGRAAAAGALVGQRFETIPFFTAQVDAGALGALAAMPDVVSIELDALDRPVLAQSAPLVNAPAAWTAGHTGAGWTVVVLDSGVEKTHGFFGGRVLSEACYSNGGGGGTSVCPGGVTMSTAVGSGVNCSSAIEGCYHGTHVAGIAAGANGPGGINGIAPGANLVSLQVFTRFEAGSATCGSSSTAPCIAAYVSDQVFGLERTLALAGPGNANRIASANMSLGGGGPFSTNCDAAQSSRKAAIDNLLSIGIATVIASGNNGFTTGVSAPACISTAVAVGSTTKTDLMSSFTNRSLGMVDLLAPGSAITASLLGNTFGSLSGTSMATPHVAGAWAVLKQALPSGSVAQIIAALQGTGVVINDTPTGTSYRRINVNAARLALLGGGVGGAPGAPGTPTISGAGNNITIAWTPPATGGTPTSYTVVARLVPGGPVLTELPVGNTLTLPVSAPNGTFHVTVRASNAAGPGPESAGVTFSVPILAPPPGAPTSLAVTVSGSQALFTWTPPATGGTATGYVMVASFTPGGTPIASLPFGAPANAATVTGIPPGTYFVRLAATNAGGTSAFSNEVTVVVAGPQVPGAPLLNAATVAGGSVGLSWTPGGGGAATSFLIVASLTPGGSPIATLPVSGTSIAVPAPSGTYVVRVHGVNAVGTGPASNEITVVVP